MSLDWKPFGKSEWACWSGAKSFPSGAVPMVADLDVDGCAAVAIVDADGLAIYWEKPGGDVTKNGEEDDLVSMEAYFHSPEAIRAIVFLEPEDMVSEQLVALGFEVG